MNCADSVLKSDELPVRGIDQCPSTLSTQRSPGLVLVKWNRLLALFTTARLNSCFVEAEAFLKCVNLLRFKRLLFFFSSLLLLSFSEFGAAHFGSVLPFAARDPDVPAPKLKVCLSLKTNIKSTLKDTKMHSEAALVQVSPQS